MQILQVYNISDKNYVKHLYLRETHSMWLLDSDGNFFNWRLGYKEDLNGTKKLNSESAMPSIVLPVEYGIVKDIQQIKDKDFMLIFNRAVYVIRNEKNIIRKTLKEVKGEFITGRVIDRKDLVLFITDQCEIYYIRLNDLLDTSLFELTITQQSKLKSHVFLQDHHLLCSISEKLILVIPKTTQTIYSWDFTNTETKELNCIIQRPWEILEEYNKSNLNSNKLPSILSNKENITRSLIHSFTEFKSPLYIIGTNIGRVFIIPLFMKDHKSAWPILRIDTDSEAAINKMCVKQRKILTGSINGSLNIIDIAPKQLLTLYEKYKEKQYIIQYKDVTNYTNLMTSSIEGFLEIYNLGHEREIERKCENSIGVIGCNHSVFIVSTNFLSITHKLKGHDSKVIGLYLLEKEDTLLVLTRKLTIYVYSMSSSILERRVRVQKAYELLDLEDKYVPKCYPTYEELFELFIDRDIVLTQGCHKALDFYNLVEVLQINWKSSANTHRLLYNEVIQREGIKKVQTKQSQIKFFNDVNNLGKKVNGKYEPCIEIGFTSIHIKIGSKDHITETLPKTLKGNINKSNKNCVLIVDLEGLLKHQQASYKVYDKGSIAPIVNLQKYEETKQTNTLHEDKHNSIESYKNKAIHDLSLLSLIHCFGFDKRLDSDLGKNFSIFPPVLDLWIGTPGIEGSFAFSVPEITDPDWHKSQGHFNWKSSSYINTSQCLILFSTLVSILHLNEKIIASIINRLLTSIPQAFSLDKTLPYPSFMKLGGFLTSKDPDVWCTARDIILVSFLRKARPETFMNLAGQLSNLINLLHEKIKQDTNYSSALQSFKEKNSLVTSNKLLLLNVCFGEQELRALIILCYIYSAHGDLAVSVLVIKQCAELICFLIK